MITIHNRITVYTPKINFTYLFFFVTREGGNLVVEKTREKVFLQTRLKDFPPTQ